MKFKGNQDKIEKWEMLGRSRIGKRLRKSDLTDEKHNIAVTKPIILHFILNQLNIDNFVLDNP